MNPDSDMSAPGQVFISTARSITDLRHWECLQDQDLSNIIKAFEASLIALASHLPPDPRITAAALIANCPNVIQALADAHRIAHPSPYSLEMKSIVAHVINTSEVDAAITWIENGGVLTLQRGSKELIDAIQAHDCPKRLALLVALKNQRPTFDDDIMEVFEAAGPQTAKALVQFAKDGEIDFPQIIADLPIQEMTLKEFAWLIALDTDLESIFLRHVIERHLPKEALDLVDMAKSNHGQIKLKSLEPSLPAICAADLGDGFFGLSSPETHLLIDAKKDH